jgi:hypothetical protein
MKTSRGQLVSDFLQELIKFSEALPDSTRDTLLVMIDRFMLKTEPKPKRTPGQLTMDI